MVSLIVPTYNEEKFINSLLCNLVEQDYPKNDLEILVVDGNSSDNTAKIVDLFVKKFNFIKLIINNKRIVPISLNIGIKESVGDIIIRIDAHAIYPINYVSQLVKSLNLLHADNVGGCIKTVPADKKIKSLAISTAISSRFGVGNSYFRIGTKKILEVDTVPFGCYRKEVFDKIGYFDEELVRNQDDELNARLIKSKGKIFLIPDIEIIYFARNTFNKLYRMFYQYGLFKPLVNKKIGTPTSLRQFAPLGLILLLISLPFFYYLNNYLFVLSMSFSFLYFILNIFFSTIHAIEQKNFFLLIYMPFTFFLIHVAYGLGFLIGIRNFIILKQKVMINKIEITR